VDAPTICAGGGALISALLSLGSTVAHPANKVTARRTATAGNLFILFQATVRLGTTNPNSRGIWLNLRINSPSQTKPLIASENGYCLAPDFTTNLTLTVTQTHKKQLLLTSLALVIASTITVCFQYFTPEQILRREMLAYVRSIAREDPRPELVRHLSPDSVPILVKWTGQTETTPTMRDRLADFIRWATLRKIDLDSSKTYADYPPALASFAFDFLGTNAASAVPQLAEIARAPRAEDAVSALLSIGAPSLDAAEKFSRDPDPNIRALGASLIARIGQNHDRSVLLLIPLLDDPHPDVRSEAYGAMAEFPGPDTEQILIPRLPDVARDLSENPMHAPTAAYALHTGSTNALVHLIDACIRATNQTARPYLLAALAARDDQHDPQKEHLRSYGARRGNYWRHLERYRSQPPNPAFDHRLYFIRSNILETGLPHVEKALAPNNSSTARLLQNPLQSRP
jgi:hypothetical protein